MTDNPTYKKKDFISDQEVRWCPGCGDYAILSSVQMAMTKIGKKKEDMVFVSGIGCSSRFPYYMNTYGMHTIHGRAPAFATAIKATNPELEVWQITGDGDGLSIGGNHLIHVIRRNVNINIILFNNEIYGLTKGQYSPTSKPGLNTKSSPYGSLDRSFNPASLALGAGSTFFARTIDTDPKHMIDTFVEASKHEGTSFIEVFQNCVIFNDKVHDLQTNRATRDEHTVRIENGKPLIFGKEKDKGIKLVDNKPTVVALSDVDESELLVHDETNPIVAQILAEMRGELPVPLGVLRRVPDVVYDQQLNDQLADVKAKKGEGDMTALLNSGDTWVVE